MIGADGVHVGTVEAIVDGRIKVAKHVSQHGKVQEMTVATWNGKVIAESDKTVVIEGNHYFPPESINRQYLSHSERTSRCPWKGTANYFSLVVDGKTNEDAAWVYAEPSDAAAAIKGHIAFWNGVEVR